MAETIGCIHNPKKICNSCRMKRWRERNVARDYYYRLKRRAWKRNIPFSISLEEFQLKCEETGYIRLRQAGYDATWDRILEYEGYTYKNMQVLVRIDNIKKYQDHIRKGGKTLPRFNLPPADYSDVPF